MNLVNTMFFFRICDGTESLIRDSEYLYIESLIKNIGSTRANLIGALANWCFINMDIERHLLYAMVKQVGERWFEEEALLFISTSNGVTRKKEAWVPHAISSKDKTTKFYLKNKAALMQCLSDFDYGRGGDRSLKSLADVLLNDSLLCHSDLTENDIITLIESEDESGDVFSQYAHALVLMVYNSICSSLIDVMEIEPSLSITLNKKHLKHVA